jgi:3-phenylpropionate/cinnamic acid dioxygenase small subunit
VLTDGDAIRNLLGRYCDLVDAGDWDAVGALFSGGRLATSEGHVLASGAADIAAFYRRGTRLHGESPRTKHLLLNTVLSFSVDDASCEARSSYVVLQAVDGVLPLQPIIAGRYVDTFTREGQAWRWDERRFDVDLAGDLTHHLGFSL